VLSQILYLDFKGSISNRRREKRRKVMSGGDGRVFLYI